MTNDAKSQRTFANQVEAAALDAKKEEQEEQEKSSARAYVILNFVCS